SVPENAAADEARKQLLDHNIRTLPVVDAEAKLVGAVGLRELTRATDTVKGVTSKAGTAPPDTPAMSLLPMLTDGRSHAVVIVDAERRILGLITQTDLLAAAAPANGRRAAAQSSSIAAIRISQVRTLLPAGASNLRMNIV
ncbi:MAG: CBS domain-containing protein, partial [Mesorhizobium sp.]